MGKNDPAHKGFYENRVWTMVELYGFSSSFALETSTASGRKRHLMEVLLDYASEERRLVERSTQPDCLDDVRGRLHDSLNWSLPPSSNLSDVKDLGYIEPMLIALCSTREGRLHAACRFGFAHAAASFIELGDSPDLCDDAGFTPLMICSNRAGREEILKALLRRFADPNTRHAKLGVTALHLSCSFGYQGNAEQLLGGAADPNPWDNKGHTALHKVAILTGGCLSRESLDAGPLVVLLLRHGADPCIRDASGRTALDLAESRGAQPVLEQLRQRMTEEQLGRCAPMAVERCYHPDPVPAARREDGVWVAAHGKAKVEYTKFSPLFGARGPKIIIECKMHSEAETYVYRLGATVWCVTSWLARRDWRGSTKADMAKDWESMAEELCGTVDCAISWCSPAEIQMRVAAGRPDLVKSLVLPHSVQDNPTIPKTREECREQLRSLMADPGSWGGIVVSAGTHLAFHGTPQAKAFVELLAECSRSQVEPLYEAEREGRDMWTRPAPSNGPTRPGGTGTRSSSRSFASPAPTTPCSSRAWSVSRSRSRTRSSSTATGSGMRSCSSARSCTGTWSSASSGGRAGQMPCRRPRRSRAARVYCCHRRRRRGWQL